MLVDRGVATFFGIPGGPVCPLFEAIRRKEGAELIAVRHESHAAFAASSYYRASGRVAAVVVTAGPGITNAVTGIAAAHAEGVPMLVLSGDVAWATHGGRLLQNSGPEGLNVEQLYSSITREQIRVTNGASAVSQTLCALDAATDPHRSGPALLVLPIDKAMEVARQVPIAPASRRYSASPAPGTIDQCMTWLSEAERPLLVLGGACLRHAALVRQLVDAIDLPFVTTPRAKGVVGEDHPRSLRNGGLAASHWARRYTAQGVDTALVLGTDLDDVSVGSTPYIEKGGKLVHVDINPLVFNRNLPTSLGITADLKAFCEALRQAVLDGRPRDGRGAELVRKAREKSPYDVPHFATDMGPQIPPHRAVADLQSSLPEARFVADIGEHMLFALHYLQANGPDEFQIQLGLGSMGSGIAGATGLALADRNRPVVCICGDGGMQMSGMEILNSVKMRLPIVYAVFNDSRYNMVHHGMKEIFGSAEEYDTPAVDFGMWAASMGIPSQVIRRGGEITRPALKRLLEPGHPVLLDIRIDRDIRVKSGGRVEALKHMSMLNHETRNGVAS